MQVSIHKLIIYFPFIFFLCRSNLKNQYVYAYQSIVDGQPLWLYVGCGSGYRAVKHISYRPTPPPKKEGQTLTTYLKVPDTADVINRVWALGLPHTIFLSLVQTKHALKVESALIKELDPVHNIQKRRECIPGAAKIAEHFKNPKFGGELFCEQINHS